MELTAYSIYDPPGLEIVPASRYREWMQQTPYHFANRCLPLLVANESGWFILNPAQFDARWQNDAHDGVQIVGATHARSHFGSGILTFHIPFIFKTEPGYNLLTRGPANWPKDGITPLEGMVETDWAHATFTMNWLFTRRDFSVRFEKDEPICMIVPQKRGELEEFDPETQLLASNPQLKTRYDEWDQSRHRFLASDRQPQEWQKDYFKGKEFAEHQVKRSIRPFSPLPVDRD